MTAKRGSVRRRDLSPLFTWRSAIAASDLAPTARHIALTLSLHMSELGDSAFPSLETMAAETGRTKETVVRALRDLEASDYLVIERGGGRQRGGLYPVNRYTAVIPEGSAQPTASAAEGVGSVAGRGRLSRGKGSAQPTGGRTTKRPEDVRSADLTAENLREREHRGGAHDQGVFSDCPMCEEAAS